MADDIDQAQAFDQLRTRLAVAETVSGHRIAAAMPGLCECEDCGDKIGAERLKVQPSARRCVNCQNALEARLGRSAL